MQKSQNSSSSSGGGGRRARRYPAQSLQDVKDNLAALGVTLWPGVAFDLTDEKDLRIAAEWIAEAATEAGLLPTQEEARELERLRMEALKKARTRSDAMGGMVLG